MTGQALPGRRIVVLGGTGKSRTFGRRAVLLRWRVGASGRRQAATGSGPAGRCGLRYRGRPRRVQRLGRARPGAAAPGGGQPHRRICPAAAVARARCRRASAAVRAEPGDRRDRDQARHAAPGRARRRDDRARLQPGRHEKGENGFAYSVSKLGVVRLTEAAAAEGLASRECGSTALCRASSTRPPTGRRCPTRNTIGGPSRLSWPPSWPFSFRRCCSSPEPPSPCTARPSRHRGPLPLSQEQDG